MYALAGGDEGYPRLLSIPHSLRIESRVVETFSADLNILVLSSIELVRAAENPGLCKMPFVAVVPVCLLLIREPL